MDQAESTSQKPDESTSQKRDDDYEEEEVQLPKKKTRDPTSELGTAMVFGAFLGLIVVGSLKSLILL